MNSIFPNLKKAFRNAKEDNLNGSSADKKKREESTEILGSKQLAGSLVEINKIEAAAKVIAPVAWIIICGEGLHNLIGSIFSMKNLNNPNILIKNFLMNLDGLSIGAAFTESFIKGASISLAIICEEFPHKIGKI